MNAYLLGPTNPWCPYHGSRRCDTPAYLLGLTNVSAWNELRIIARDVPLGTSIGNGRCPFCRGGINGDSAFSVTRDEETSALFICHRAKCGEHGRVFWGGGGANTSTDRPIRVPIAEVYTGATRPLGTEFLSILRTRYDLDEKETAWAGWREGIDDGLLVCPIRGPDGLPRGTETRNLLELPWFSKTRVYRDGATTRLGWIIRHRGEPWRSEVVIVEDLVSALKVSRHARTAAILGSHINPDQLEEILTVNIRGVICLDADATDKANKILRRYRFLAPNFRVVRLSKDMKYESDERIKELIT